MCFFSVDVPCMCVCGCFQDLLSPTGVFYMVVVVENKPKDIAAILAKDGFTMTVRGENCGGR